LDFLGYDSYGLSLFCYACLQRDSAGLATQNNELKIRLQAMEQQAQLRDGKLLAVVSLVGVCSKFSSNNEKCFLFFKS